MTDYAKPCEYPDDYDYPTACFLCGAPVDVDDEGNWREFTTLIGPDGEEEPGCRRLTGRLAHKGCSEEREAKRKAEREPDGWMGSLFTEPDRPGAPSGLDPATRRR